MASRIIWTSLHNEGLNGAGPLHHNQRMHLHMSFYWGYKTQILFHGWPGNSKPMYALALIFVFFLAFMVELLAYQTNLFLNKSETTGVVLRLYHTGVYTVRSGVQYMVMLAVISFNGGVFLAALCGHAVGFILFRSGLFFKPVRSVSFL